MSSTVKVNLVGNASGLTSAANSASASLKGMASTALGGVPAFGKIGSAMMSAFSPENLKNGPGAAIAIGTAIIATYKEVFDTLIQSSEAYFKDAQSIRKLDVALINNTNATNEQIHGIERQIDKLQLLSTIQDDDLRQSYSNIVASTKDATKSMEILTIAADVSAGSGISLEKVSKAITRAYMGQGNALNKLLPGMGKGEAALTNLKNAYNGAAAAVGNASPFERIKVAGENIQEALGMVLAPLIEKFANWLTSDDFQGLMDAFINFCRTAAIAVYSIVKPAMDFFSQLTSPEFIAAFKMIFGGLTSGATDTKNDTTDAFDGIIGGLDELRSQLGKLKGMKFTIGDDPKKPAEIAQRIKDAAAKIKDSGKKFAEALNFSEYLNKDTGVFDAKGFMEKFQGIVRAARALPAKLRALRKAGASSEVLQQIVAMGPEQGLAVAQGFLSEAGSVKSYAASMKQLDVFGQQAMANASGQNNYTINVTKANMTAEEIIREIQKYERKTGKKVVF